MASRKGVLTSLDSMKLAGLQNVRILSRMIPNLMEVADPVPELYQKLDLKQLTKLMKVGLKYQNRMINIEMERLKTQQESIGEMERIIEEIGR